MKVKNNVNKPPSSIKGSAKAGGASAGKKAGSAKSSRNSAQAVTVSSTDKLATRMSSDAADRADRVAQIKLEVESGNYEVDSDKTADKLIDSLTDYSLA